MSQIFRIAVFLMATWSVQAQSVSPAVLASSGGEGSSGQNTLQWTMGELSITTLSQGDRILTQGFHQPNVLITSSEDEVEIGLSIYPNPAHSQIVLDYQGTEEFEFDLLSIQGASAARGALNIGQTQVDVQDLPSGHYILTIIKGNEIVQSFKIEKTGL